MSEAITATRRPTATVGAFTAAGYVGWVAGAPIIGFVSDTWGLARGLQVLAAMAALVLVAAALRRPRPLPGAAPPSE
jgi:predicted MFS family arabinose efflux permease